MTVAEMISALQDHGFDDASAARLLEKVNSAYYDICSREPWPFLEKTAALTFAGGTDAATGWPSDFRAATIVALTSNGGGKLKKMRYDDWLEKYGASPATGVPTVWYMVGDVAHFYPTPSASVTITLGYIKRPAALTALSAEAAVIVPLEFHPVIVDGALFKLYAMEDDTDIAPTFETYFERGIINMREFVWRKDYSTQDIIHPVDADDTGSDGWYSGWTG